MLDADGWVYPLILVLLFWGLNSVKRTSSLIKYEQTGLKVLILGAQCKFPCGFYL
jgi:hypothetical protein